MNERKIFKIQKLDTISPTFCAAKWARSDIYLHTGVTSSCHYPYPHKIDLDLVKSNPLAIHNTSQKISERRDMLAGIQTEGCSNCWNIENVDSELISDRINYSYAFKDLDFEQFTLGDTEVPRRIAVIFDTYCNFTCVYCDPSQSTSWATDVKTNGYYRIKTDQKKTYIRTGSKDLLSDSDFEFLNAQFREMVRLSLPDLRELVILGGEPTMSPGFWQFMEWLSKEDVSNLKLRITTNLSHKNLVKRFLALAKPFKEVNLNISVDGAGATAEFIRYGLKWDEFVDSIEYLLTEHNIKLYISNTLNILSLDSLTDFVDWVSTYKIKYPERIILSIAIVRWPFFQSIFSLPEELRIHYASTVEQCLKRHEPMFYDSDDMLHKLRALPKILRETRSEYLNENEDFRYFIREFSRRRNIQPCFSDKLTEWMKLDSRL